MLGMARVGLLKFIIYLGCDISLKPEELGGWSGILIWGC